MTRRSIRWPTRRACLAASLAPWCVAPVTAQTAVNPGVTGRQILIGQSLTLDAGKNDYGVAVRQGVEAALRQVNAAGGIHGRQLAIQVMDDGSKAPTAEANARKLVADGVFLLFGSIEGGPSTAVMKVAVDNGVPFFGPMAGSPTLRRPRQPLVFPVRAEHREEFGAILAHAQGLGMRRAAFLQSDSEVGRLHLGNAQIAARALGLGEVMPLVIGSEVSDAQLDGFVKQLRDANIELLFNHGSAGVYERLIRKVRSVRLRLALYGVNSGSAQLATRLGELAQGMVFTQVVPSPWERKTALTRDYQDAFRAAFNDQEFSYGSLEGYVTLRALAESLRRAGPDLSRASLLRALADVSFDIAGFRLRYNGAEHVGSTYVDTAIVTREGRFRH
ncbi:MAG: ABC transporter substrate-binding protein [Vitreoscilla sp.]|nr:ABC transporter substrate-binding protein [Vitreoscilla sp.]